MYIEGPMYIEGKACWLNHLENALQKYNNRVHGTTKMTPFEMSTNKTAKLASQKLVPNLIFNNNKNKLPKFQVGDFIRFPDKRTFYSKSYTTNWNRELLKIHKINPTKPVTYGSVDENNELIEGKYYEQELLRSKFNFESNNKMLEIMNIFHQFE